MNHLSKIHEKFLYEIWKEQDFIKNLTTNDGQQINIIDAGSQNKDFGGPDFKNARIKIGNITYLGDVEIDTCHSDWISHGHNINKKYNKVILHAVIKQDNNKPYVYTQDGRKVQSISLTGCLRRDIYSTLQGAILEERKNRINKMPCGEMSQTFSEKEKLDFLFDLGSERFKKKCDKIFERLKEITYLNELKLKEPIVKYNLDESFYKRKFTYKDFVKPVIWQQLLFESVSEALGYSKNKEIMHKLAIAVQIEFFKEFMNKEDFQFYIEAALFNIAGLLPDVHKLPDEETSAYTKKLYECWSEIKQKYDGKTFHYNQWHFYKLRPQNFPTVRLAGSARIIYKILKQNLLENVIQDVEMIDNPHKLTNKLRSLFIVKGDGFWRKHFVFDQPSKITINYFIGVSRADEILINILMPILWVYFEIFGKKHLSNKIIKLYTNFYQKSENNLVNEISSTLNLNDSWKRSILYQGMIELFRSYCSRQKCLECFIGKKVFS